MKPSRVVLVAFLAVAAAGASADEPSRAAARGAFHQGGQEVSLVSGYGFGFQVGFVNPDGDDVESVPLFLRWGVGITDPLRPQSWYGGNLEFGVEASFLFNTQPRSGFSGGGILSLRYNFLRGGRFVPYVEGGAGMAGTDFDIVEQSDGFNFILQAGVGIHCFVTEWAALTTAYRYQHISNAGLRFPNGGLDWNFVLVGATLFFD